MARRVFSSLNLLKHENPLGLPRSNRPPLPPQIPRRQAGLPQRRDIPGVKKVIAISSAKGGVGKSTIAANLALAFARKGLKTGILDADIFGPSVPTLMNLSGEPRLTDDNRLIPLTNYGVKTMSMGYLVPKDSPIVWRGLMVMKALQQLLHEVEWGGLDMLVLDMPPGTGDVQLTITQQINVAGAVIVSTPQDVALADAIRGINMFKKVNIPLLGMVQNMSIFTCPKCGEGTHIFGEEGVLRTCKEHEVDFLGDVPLHAQICHDADQGKPTVVAEPDGPRAAAFTALADRIYEKL